MVLASYSAEIESAQDRRFLVGVAAEGSLHEGRHPLLQPGEGLRKEEHGRVAPLRLRPKEQVEPQ